MRLQFLSSLIVPASALFLHFALWSSPVARAQDAAEYALPADADAAALLNETEEGDLRASCSATNKVYIKYCKDPRDGFGTCVVRSGCKESGATDKECEKDFKTVCGYVPELWFYD